MRTLDLEETNEGLPFTPKYAAEVLTVFMAELVYLNRLQNVEHCIVNTTAIYGNFMDLLSDALTGHYEKSIMDAAKLATDISASLHDCETAGKYDAVALAHWFENKMGSKQLMVDAVSANAHLHPQEIQDHVEEVWDVFFKYNQPSKCGQALGKVAYWAFGPVDKTDNFAVEFLQ